ncbi:cvaB, IS186 transposase domain protein [Escherichia coli DEC10F]|nr:cvaB, IS186 transposase domain protein [Escherichia coli DEC10F]
MLLLTSLPEDEYSAEQVADCYRLRWQIELAFKRLKSLLHLDALRAKEPELAKAWIFANLLAAFLIDDIIQPSLDFPPTEVPDPKERTNSLWRITKIGHLELTGGHSWDSIPDSLQNAIEEREASS